MGVGRSLHGGPDQGEDSGHHQTDRGIGHDNKAVGVDRRQPAGQQGLGRKAGGQRAGRRCEVAGEVVPGKGRCPPRVRGCLAEGRLLDRQERPDLVATRADDTDGRGEDQERHPARQGKSDAGDDHQQRAGDENTSPPESIRTGGQPQRDDRVADQRQGEDQADRDRVDPERGEIEDEDDRQRAIAEHPQHAGDEQQPAVTIEAAQAGDEAAVERLAGRRGHGSPRARREAGGGCIAAESTCENASGGDGQAYERHRHRGQRGSRAP